MPERVPCEFFLVRYVPDPVKGEFTNIGVILREAGNVAAPNAAGPAPHVRFTRDWTRVRCMDSDADIALLEALEAELDVRLRAAEEPGKAGSKPILDVLEDSLSNSLQISEPRACLAENVAAEMDLLMSLYVEPIRVKAERRRTGRAAIAASMRTQFERGGVWGLMRKRIAAAEYTQPGDPLRIDCGYRAGELGSVPPPVIRMFHAVSLEGDVEAAKVLAYSAPRLREGVLRGEAATLDLAAVVEPLRQLGGAEEERTEQDERYGFGVRTMEEQGIRVITLNDLARAAETARMELRV